MKGTFARIFAKLTAFLRGVREFRWSVTWADPARDQDPDGFYTDLDDAYDRGRECAHRMTLRRFDR